MFAVNLLLLYFLIDRTFYAMRCGWKDKKGSTYVNRADRDTDGSIHLENNIIIK
jgi:hypothetical protein